MEPRNDMLTHGVYIVCAQHEGKRGGLAVAWATQVSTNRVLVCIGKQSATRGLILGSKAFGLSVLGQGQVDIARAFGKRSSRNVDKFEGVSFHEGETGSPLLDNCLINLDCQVESVYDEGVEKLIIGSVVSAEYRGLKQEPLVYREEDY